MNKLSPRLSSLLEALESHSLNSFKTEKEAPCDNKDPDEETFDELEVLANHELLEDLEQELHKPKSQQYYEDEEEEYQPLALGWYHGDDYEEMELGLLEIEATYSLRADEALHQKDSVIYLIQLLSDPAMLLAVWFDPSDIEDTGISGLYQQALNASLTS